MTTSDNTVEAADGLATTSTQPQHRLAARHIDCPCYLDPRCQMAVAFQEARDYWARNPDDTANAPNEIHESIEKWLIAKRLLSGPAQATQEVARARDFEEPRAAESPGKRAGFKLPRIPPLTLRRLALPRNSSAVLPLKPGRLPRRHTESETSIDRSGDIQDDASLPTSPKKILRNMAVVFRSTRQKRHLADSTHGLTNTTSAEMARRGNSDSTLASTSEEESCVVPINETNSVTLEDTSSIYEDTTDAIELLLSTVESGSPGDAASGNAPSDTSETGEKMQPTEDHADAAYAALMPILYELEAFAEHPKHRAIAADNADEDYSQFWETFAQLSAKEVLYAVYAIRSGILDMPDHVDNTRGDTVVVLLALWGLVASALSMYLYWSLP
ncbi:hypothetical protein BV20DRAFT_707169 [Pilatotrama ljubarskyi]|nr:hypothetical protein BV20DRAFT_707169 [Pilatotrama ljubarskyi]